MSANDPKQTMLWAQGSDAAISHRELGFDPVVASIFSRLVRYNFFV